MSKIVTNIIPVRLMQCDDRVDLRTLDEVVWSATYPSETDV